MFRQLADIESANCITRIHVKNIRIETKTMNKTFPTSYWGDDKSTRAHFTPLEQTPDDSITSCFVVAITPDQRIAISRPKRGWGLPGGHVEAGESPEGCTRREVA